MSNYPEWLAATLASDATDGRGVLANGIRALWPEFRLVGPAFVVLASQDDNLAVLQAAASSPPVGSVLVVAGLSTSRTATVGDLMALEIQNLGFAGLVTDGLVRDSLEIKKLGFPVWCRGTTPTASAKRGPAVVGGAVTIGGTVVHDGDLVIADDDGVVIWPSADFDSLLARARLKFEADEQRLERLRQARAAIQRSPQP